VFGVLNAIPLAIEGGIAAHGLWSAAASVEDGIAPGAADEVGQMVEGRGADERNAAMARQQEENVEIAEEAQERERESANDRQALLDREEQQRQAAQSHREATYDSAKAFGVEPEGLRSLTPELRAELAKFEYGAPPRSLRGMGCGRLRGCLYGQRCADWEDQSFRSGTFKNLSCRASQRCPGVQDFFA